MNELNFIQELIANKQRLEVHFPDKQEAESFVNGLFHFLFVSTSGKVNTDKSFERITELKSNLTSLLFKLIKDKEVVQEHTNAFFKALPAVYKMLLKDAEAILSSDPAAGSIAEVIVAYPGFYATVVYRLSHILWKRNITMLPRIFCEHAHSKTGIDIHPGAEIGAAFAIDHGTGIVIGETSVIGDNVKIYQGVTLGALNVSKYAAKIKRHPTIEDGVVIYSGATILGGETVIGSGSIVGGNVWLTYSIPSNSVVYHKSEIKVKDRNPFPEPLNFSI